MFVMTQRSKQKSVFITRCFLNQYNDAECRNSWPWENLSSVPCCYANGHCVFLCISIVNSTLMVWQGFSCGSPSHVNVMIPQTHSHTHISHCHWNCTFNKLTMHCLCLTTSEMTLNYIITLDYRENEPTTRLREGSTWMIMHDTKGSRRIVMTSSTSSLWSVII